MKKIVGFFFLLSSLAFGDLTQTVLFVSLGSQCTPANFIKLCGIRTAAFPFDWILSMDGEKLIELLEEDFSHFLTQENLILDDHFALNTYHVAASGILLNPYYHLAFLHEGNWRGNFLSTMETFKSRYERRIARFRSLKNFPGKVFFIRASHPHFDPHRFFRFQENFELSENYSFRLYNTLKNYFPNLDFTLIIMNFHEKEKDYITQRNLADHLLAVTFPVESNAEMMKKCTAYFYELIGERSLFQNDQLLRIKPISSK